MGRPAAIVAMLSLMSPVIRTRTTADLLRIFALAIFVFQSLGVAAELWLIGHTEDRWQWLPLVLLGLGLLVLGVRGFARGGVPVRIFQCLMVAFLIGGGIGLYQHYQGNAEFELEMYPSRAGLELFWESIRGATPALAPGTMVGLGLLGLASTFRHPALSRVSAPDSSMPGDC